MTRRPEEPPKSSSSAPDSVDEVLLTPREKRRVVREARRQALDAAYELRMKRKRAKDGTSWRGHHIVDSQGLAEAFPDPETPEIPSSTVRRRITHGVTLVLLIALVVAAVVLVGMVQRGELVLKLGADKPTPTPEICPAETLDYPANKTVTVNVYNGGSIEGKAGQVAKELTKRGYPVKAIENKSTDYASPTVVISGSSGHAAAFNMQRNFPNSEYVQDDRADGTVDVIVTGLFNGLVAPPKVDQTPGALSCPRLSPPPSPPPSEPAVTAPIGG
ncbi:LytR C-terminal domain-containing protein [Arthrobacter sp. TMP15]|uniref:LytR C-terminal domain-containing protein n=1 Tax=Arthrobacter sp. TMP15 TaxID=3140789 RepID=UPI0031B9B815